MIAAVVAAARRTGLHAALLIGVLIGPYAYAQVPIPLQEQIRVFNSLPASQQQSMIRELQGQLPPAQREAIVNMLQGRDQTNNGNGGQMPELDSETANALQQAIDRQRGNGNEQPEDQQNPRFKPHDTAVLQFTRAPSRRQQPGLPQPVPRTADEQQKLQEFLDRLQKGNPYELDTAGQLMLPGVPSIGLAGLNVQQATIRIEAEPALKPFTVVVTRLPLQPVGTEALKPFGYDLFERQRTSFSPVADIPVPTDYVIGPGDTVNVQLFGNQNQEYFLEVSREGTINFPEIGPDQRERPHVRRHAQHDQPARDGADDRRAREHHARRAAFDPRVRARRRREARVRTPWEASRR